MGWRSFAKDGSEKVEGVDGRPVQDGEEGNLLVIAQEDYGHKIAVDLINGMIAIDYENLGVQNGIVEISNPKAYLWMCDETNIAGDLAHYSSVLVDYRDEDGRKVIQDGRFVQVRNDTLTPLTFRPIWFTRMTNGEPTKVIGVQTTLPKEFGEKNVKKMVSIFTDGRLGIH